MNKQKDYYKGILLSQSAFVFSAFVGLYSYRYVWENFESNVFTIWIAIFEISQFFLLFDLGFSQAFIKKHGNLDSSFNVIIKESRELRAKLLISGILASTFTIISAKLIGVETLEFEPFIILSLSVLITLLSYTETSVLRLQRKFTLVYSSVFLGGTGFILSIWFLQTLDLNPLYVISISNLFRVLIIYIYQIVLIKSFPYISKFKIIDIDSSIILLNLSYFLLIMLDVFILKKAQISVFIIAQLAANKKLFDIGRGLVDSALQVLSVKYARIGKESNRSLLINIFVVIVLYLSLLLFSGWVLPIWLTDYEFSFSLSLALCLSMCAVSIFRNVSLKEYYASGRVLHFIIISVFSKLSFIIVLNITNEVALAYYLQGFILVLFIFYIIIRLNCER